MHLNTVLVIKNTKNVIAESGVDALEVFNCHLVHGSSGLLGECYALAGDVVGGSEWDALADKVIGEIGGDHEGATRIVSKSKERLLNLRPTLEKPSSFLG